MIGLAAVAPKLTGRLLRSERNLGFGRRLAEARRRLDADAS